MHAKSLYRAHMDAFEPFFKDDKYREVISKLSQLEKGHLEYVSFKITPADLSKIIIPKLVKDFAIEMCCDEVRIINMILRNFVVEQLEGTSVNYRKLIEHIKEFDDMTDEQKQKLIHHLSKY